MNQMKLMIKKDTLSEHREYQLNIKTNDGLKKIKKNCYFDKIQIK